MIDIQHLEKSYKGKEILKNVQLKINDPSNIQVLIGESGSGKSTLFNLLMGLDNDYSGNYSLFGKSAKEISNSEWASIREHEMRMVFQDYKLLNHLTVYDNIYLSGDYSEKEIIQVLEELDIKELKDSFIHELSGGQKQRVAISRAVISEPKILLMDEPTGNLDGMTTNRIMSYLSKLRDKGILVFIITHDEQVARLADIVYEIKDKKIVLVKDQLDASEDEISYEKQPSSKKKIHQYVWKNLKQTKKKHFLLAIPTILIITLFILGFSAYRSSSTQSFLDFFAGVGDRTIILDTEQLKQEVREEFNEEGIIASSDGERIAFSMEDVGSVQNIPHVEATYLFSDGVQSPYDHEELQLNLTIVQDDFSEEFLETLVYGHSINMISFQFSAMQLPTDYLPDYNTESIELIAGKFPTDETNEILVPDIYLLLSQESLGETVTLPVEDFENNQTEKDYVISGVYDSVFRQDLKRDYFIYTSHEMNGFANAADEEGYRFFERILTETPQSEAFNKNLIGNYENFEEAYGTGYKSMFVRVDAADNIEVVRSKLENLYPSYSFTSQYDLKHGDLSEIYSMLVRVLVIGSMGIALLAGVMITFLNKSHINNRNSELAILYSLGYKRKDIFSIIALENGLLFSFYLGFSGLLAYLANVFVLSGSRYYQLFVGMFSLSNVGLIVLLIGLMLLVSVLWSLNGVKQANLMKYLNE